MREQRRSWRYNIELTPNEKNVLLKYFVAELNLYNSLNQALSSRVRQVPEGFIEMSNNLRVFGEVFEHKIDLRKSLKEHALPEVLEPVKEDIAFLSEKALSILDVAQIKTPISPRTKRNMGVQMFRFYAEQARAFIGNTMRFAPSFLENFDIVRKRHIQLHRKAMIVEYNEENKESLLTIPYFNRKIKIDGNVKNAQWDVLILHQQPNIMVSNTTPWCIDLKRTSDDYILKYLDNGNPNRNSSFSMTRNDYRKTSF